MPLLEPSELIQLPKGQAFVLMEGGVLYKVRMPLPSSDDDDLIPESIQTLADEMRKTYATGENWWVGADMGWTEPDMNHDESIALHPDSSTELAQDLLADDLKISQDERAFIEGGKVIDNESDINHGK